MAKKRDLKKQMGGMFDRTEPAPSPAEPPTPAAIVAPSIPEATTPETEQAEQTDPILDMLAVELARRGLRGRELDTALTAFAVARATEATAQERLRDRRDWGEVARRHGKPQTFRLWSEIIERLAELAEPHKGQKHMIVNVLLRYGLDAVEAGELDLVGELDRALGEH